MTGSPFNRPIPHDAYDPMNCKCRNPGCGSYQEEKRKMSETRPGYEEAEGIPLSTNCPGCGADTNSDGFWNASDTHECGPF